MKKLFFLLPLLVLLYACDSGKSGATSGKDIKLTTAEDSMYYAFGSSIVKGMNLEGLTWNAANFEKGLKDEAAGTTTIEMPAVMQQIQEFGREAQARNGRAITAEDGLTSNMDEVSYAYGVYFVSQLKDINMEPVLEPLAAGFNDANAGTSLFAEAESQLLTNKFNQIASNNARAAQAEKSQAEAGPNKEAGKAFMDANKEKDGVQVHESGMQYKVLKSGKGGGASPTLSDKVTIHYTGRLLDGTVFDSSEKGEGSEPVTFDLTRLIRGWQIALPLMKPGEKWTIWLPSDIAYGDVGSPPNIPPGATLEFDIEFFGIGE